MHAQYREMYEGIRTKMEKSIIVLENEYRGIRAGRANPAILDSIKVEYYGTPSPLTQVASISVPEARTLVVQPWDANILKDIERAILKSELGITPNNDGKSIRLNFPQLTEERRREIAKLIHKEAEDTKVAIRNIRRDAIEHYKDLKKKSEITEDDLKDIEKDIQELTDKFGKIVEGIASEKEKEIMSV